MCNTYVVFASLCRQNIHDWSRTDVSQLQYTQSRYTSNPSVASAAQLTTLYINLDISWVSGLKEDYGCDVHLSMWPQKQLHLLDLSFLFRELVYISLACLHWSNIWLAYAMLLEGHCRVECLNLERVGWERVWSTGRKQLEVLETLLLGDSEGIAWLDLCEGPCGFAKWKCVCWIYDGFLLQNPDLDTLGMGNWSWRRRMVGLTADLLKRVRNLWRFIWPSSYTDSEGCRSTCKRTQLDAGMGTSLWGQRLWWWSKYSPV